MPITSGPLTPAGAIVDIQVGVGPNRRRLLQRLGMPAPRPIIFRAVIDTGSKMTGLTARAFAELQLSPVGRVAIRTPSTRSDTPHVCDMYQVGLALMANGIWHPFGGVRVIATGGWNPNSEEGVEALIGRDLLDRCNFWYQGPDRQFTLAF
jgi:hypothetical protein